MAEQEARNKARRQVLLALDVANPSLAVLELSAFLAAQLEARLHGLLVEDIDLFQVAELPFTREVVLFSAQERRFEGSVLSRSLNRIANRLQTELARVAEDARLSWSFDTVRGRRISLLLEVGTTSDVLIVARSRLQEWRPEDRYPPLFFNNSIYFVYTGTSLAERALIMAAALTRQRGRPLRLLVPQDSENLVIQAKEKLRELRLPQATILEVATPVPVEDIGKRFWGEALILPADIPELHDLVWFQKLLDKICFPLVLVR